jgi:hypothetical protein
MLLLTATVSLAQTSSTMIFSNANEYPEDRYKDVKGNPYFFEEWVFADVYSQNGDVFKGMVTNYNIDEQVFELRRGKEYLVLDPYFYWCVIVNKSENGNALKEHPDSVLFIRGLMPDDEKKFVQVIYNGVHIKLLRDMHVAESVKVFQNVGQTITNKRFNRKDDHFLVIDGQYVEVKLKKKEILKILRHEDELDDWLKENKNKLKSDEEFAAMLEYYEENLLKK